MTGEKDGREDSAQRQKHIDVCKGNVREEFLKKERIVNMKLGFKRMIDRTDAVFSKKGRLYEKYAKKVKKTRRKVISSLARNLREAARSFEANGIRVHGPYNTKEAVDKIHELLAGEKLVVKSKSKVTKEIGLSHGLAERGVEVVETDVGDRALQLFEKYHKELGLLPEKPRHASGPGIGLNRYDFAKVLSKAYGVDLSGLDGEELIAKEVSLVRNDVLAAVSKANVGITGANALTLDGAIVVMHNEGNISKTFMLSKLAGGSTKHIVVTSIEKILPTVEDVIAKTKVEAIYATGAPPSYIEIISDKSKTADIERVLFPGVYGPREVHIVLVDNGRSRVAESEFSEVLTCVGCGRCVFNCPAYNKIGPALGYRGYPGGIGTVFCALYKGVETAVENGLYLCTTCGSCSIECPMKIKTHKIIPKLRQEAAGKNLLPELESVRKNISDSGNIFGSDRGERWSGIEFDFTADSKDEPEYLLFVGCLTSFQDKENANAVLKILNTLGVKYTILEDEVCCGEILKVLGDKESFNKVFRMNEKKFSALRVKKILTICPSCFDTLKKNLKGRFKVMHFTQFLAENMDKLKLSADGAKMRMTYHDPCHLGRYHKIYDEPREILKKAGAEVVELEKNREKSWCCGAGGGLLTIFPRVSGGIAEDRFSQIESLKVDTVVTCCPGCKNNLNTIARRKKSAVKVVNLPELVAGKIHQV